MAPSKVYGVGASGQPQGSRPMSTAFLALVVFFVGMLLIGMNWWHAMRCVSESSSSQDAADAEVRLASLERRLLAAEAENAKNVVLLRKVLKALEHKYIQLSDAEYKRMVKESEEESVRLALGIASQPPPPIPEFEMDDKILSEPSVMSTFIDDIMRDVEDMEERGGNEDRASSYTGEGEEGGEMLQDDIFKEEMDGEDEETAAINAMTPDEKKIECSKLKDDYNVVIGVSWGNLPYNLQEYWRKLICDKYFI